MKRLVDFENGFRGSFSVGFNRPGRRGRLVSRGRDAIAFICDALLAASASPKVLAPAFICEEVHAAFVNCGVELLLYDLAPDLAIDPESLRQGLSAKPDAVFFVNYYGFPQPTETVKTMADSGALIIEDNTHGFLSGSAIGGITGARGWTFASLRKLFPLPDGAYLGGVGRDCILPAGIETSPRGYVFSRLMGLLFKTIQLGLPLSLIDKVRQEFFTMAVRREGYPYKRVCSKPSGVLFPLVDFEKVMQIRRANYRVLAERVNPEIARPVYAALPEGVCPFGFPVLSERRDALKEGLLRFGIHAPVLWKTSSHVDEPKFPGAAELARKILLIPVGQGYGVEDMGRVADAINSI